MNLAGQLPWAYHDLSYCGFSPEARTCAAKKNVSKDRPLVGFVLGAKKDEAAQLLQPVHLRYARA